MNYPLYLETKGKLKNFHTETSRAGFAKLWVEKNCKLIVDAAVRLPESFIFEDGKLLMYVDFELGEDVRLIIERIIIENYRMIKHADFRVNPDMNIFVGDNDSGKSTLLESTGNHGEKLPTGGIFQSAQCLI